MILKHYLLRTLKEPVNFIMLILFPSVMIAITTFAFTGNMDSAFYMFDGYNRSATTNLTFNGVFFMFFSGMIVTDYLYLEFRSDMRWRLMATPVRFGKFVSAAIVASMIVAVLNTVIVFAFGIFVLNAHWHNPVITIAVLLLTGVFVTMLGVLLFLLIPKKSTTTAIIMAFAFAQIIILNFNMLPIAADSVGVASFLPVVAGVRAMEHSGIMMIELVGETLADGFVRLDSDMRMSLIHLGILAGFAVVTTVAVAIVGRKRKI